jgi:Fe2+ or Zn2+ uptake regulation protein
VYTILSQLADLRIYSRRLSATNKMFFDINTSHHIHLYDRENHTFRDLVDDELQSLISAHLKRRRFKGYTVEDIDIQYVARPTRKNKNA